MADLSPVAHQVEVEREHLVFRRLPFERFVCLLQGESWRDQAQALRYPQHMRIHRKCRSAQREQQDAARRLRANPRKLPQVSPCLLKREFAEEAQVQPPMFLAQPAQDLLDAPDFVLARPPERIVRSISRLGATSAASQVGNFAFRLANARPLLRSLVF